MTQDQNDKPTGNKSKKQKYLASEKGKATNKAYYQKRKQNRTEEEKQHIRKLSNQWYHNNKEKVKDATLRIRKENPERTRSNNLKRMYKLTIDGFAKLLASQNGVCAMCGLPPEDGKVFTVDHDHRCCPGKKSCGTCIRGLLHQHCNAALGNLRDSLELATKACEYIKKQIEEITD